MRLAVQGVRENELDTQRITAESWLAECDGVFGERPVRILYSPNGIIQHAFSGVPGWSDGALAQIDMTREEATENGITIIPWGTLFGAERTTSYTVCLPDETWHDMYDVYRTPDDTPGFGLPLTAAGSPDAKFVEAAQGVIVWNWPLHSYHATFRRRRDYAQMRQEMYTHLVELADNEAAVEPLLRRLSEEALTNAAAILNSRSTAFVRDLRNNITNDVERFQSYQREIREIERILQERRAALDAAIAVADDGLDEATLHRELRMLDDHANVKLYTVNENGTAEVVTTAIPISNPDGETCDLGPYTLKLHFNPDNAHVSITNLVNPRGSFQHPHVRDGDFCAGEWSGTVSTLLRNGEISAAVAFIIECLRSVNYRDDWGRHYTWWFGADPEDEQGARRYV